jgi:hypothetical protein
MDWYTGKSLDPLRDGVVVTLAGQRFTIPECSGEAYERLIPHFAVVTRAKLAQDANNPIGEDEQISVLRAQRMIATVYLRANYPSLSEELVASYLTLADISAVIEAGNEARARASGEKKPGEASAGDPKPALN